MTQASRPTCFVAMAFDHDDTDSLYDQQILPTLRRLGIRFVRIDRRQSNDDVNIQIMEQLQSADFCITDLTYARPSAYFEAGFAQRSTPVIYTVRRDHLSRAQPDHLRVHFDLQMKPIIPWKSPSDSSFANRLEKRLKATVLSDWKRIDRLNLKNENDKQRFSSLPLHFRLTQLRRQAIYAMRKVNIKPSSFKVDGVTVPASIAYETRRKNVHDGSTNSVEGEALHGKKALTVSIQAFDLATRADLQTIKHEYISPRRFDARIRSEPWKQIESIYSNILIMSLRPLSATQIERIFDICTPVEKGRTYAISGPYSIHDRNVAMAITVHILSGIESFAQSKAWLDTLIVNYLERQTSRKAGQ